MTSRGNDSGTSRPPAPANVPPPRRFPWRTYLIVLGIDIALAIGVILGGHHDFLRGGDLFVFPLIAIALAFGLIVMFPAAFFLFRSRKYRSPEWDIWVRLPIWLGLGVAALGAGFIFFFFTCLATLAK